MSSFTSPWALRRQILYFFIFLAGFLFLLAVPTFLIFYKPTSCFDNKRNGSEVGVDCGGSCELFCSTQVASPIIRFARSFKVRDGEYSALAYTENQNIYAGTSKITYQFEFYDDINELIGTREGEAYLPPQSIVPIFEGRINLAKPPVRTFFKYTGDARWIRMETRRGDLMVRNQVLSGINKSPRLSAELENLSVFTFNDIDVVAIIYDVRDNATAVSRTLVDSISKDEKSELVFTWPEPFPTRVERCQAPADIALLMDTSGSMNDDDITPPQPITDAKNAAISFVNRMTSSDRISIITFATRAEHKQKLVENLVVAQNSISSISILPEEENGFTNIGEAIMLASAELIEGANNRGSASSAELERSIILLTDGRANQPTDPGGEIYAFEQARIARAQGIKIFTIGLGEKVNKDFLLEMASDAESNFFAVTSRELTEIYKKISESICERGPAIVDIIPLSRDMLSPF